MFDFNFISGRHRLNLLAVAVGTAMFPVMAEESTTATPRTDEQTLTVTASPEAPFVSGGDKLVPAYLDGQVANGGRMGMLGEQDARNVPFNVISYTSKLIQDQQAKTIKDVVANDASVQNVTGYGNFAETYRIRGFDLNGDDMTFGGLSGVVPRQVVSTQMIDRVEVFKGANALMNGSASSGVGGMINLEPKHADDVPLTRLGVDYTSKNQIGGSLDAGRRFGDNNQWGARVNLLNREGDTAVSNEKQRTTLAAIGLDYRGERLRTSLDAGYQKQTYHGGRLGVNVSGVDFIPEVPKATSNYSQSWVFSDLESRFGMARAEYDVAQDWTLYGAVGGQHSHEYGTYGTPKLLNSAGNATIGRMDTNKYVDGFSGQFGVRGSLATGVIKHSVNLGYSAQTRREKTAYGMALGAGAAATNIYLPSAVTEPEMTYFGGELDDPRPTSRIRSQGVLLSDTLSMLDDKILLTVGARHQKVVVRNYSYGTVAEKVDERFTQTRWTPAYGIVVKPWETVSLYANHIESLSPGETAPNSAVNVGTVSGISLAKQNEVGVKFDSGRVGGTLALFEIKKPKGLTDPETKYFSLAGEQRNRGIELNVFGEPVYGVRLNGSATWLDPTMSKTQNGTNDGKKAVGVAEFYTVLGAEYDIKPVDGLAATARLNHSGSQYANAANTKKLGAYTTLDLGARYSMKMQDNEMVWRVGVDNVTNKRYWSGVESSGTYIYQGSPRQLKVSVNYDF